mmetsp:Transcript_7523/g.13593  ORF Transcript_7523/g.13593 Transcript_7523/m.13593 type:complete len:80 (+) Transcript_7523:472-711(+)
MKSCIIKWCWKMVTQRFQNWHKWHPMKIQSWLLDKKNRSKSIFNQMHASRSDHIRVALMIKRQNREGGRREIKRNSVGP